MKLTVFGATGGIGREVVAQGLDAGHHVVGVVRDGYDLQHPALTVVQVPGLTDPERSSGRRWMAPTPPSPVSGRAAVAT